MKTRLTTKGFSEYLEAIAASGQNIDAIADEALAAGGDVLLKGMQRRCPVLKEPDPRFKAGNLRDHLTCTDPVQDGNFHYVEVGLPRSTDAKTAIYGNVQEFGSSDVSAQPYIRPALDEDMTKARTAMRTVFKTEGAL